MHMQQQRPSWMHRTYPCYVTTIFECTEFLWAQDQYIQKHWKHRDTDISIRCQRGGRGPRGQPRDPASQGPHAHRHASVSGPSSPPLLHRIVRSRACGMHPWDVFDRSTKWCMHGLYWCAISYLDACTQFASPSLSRPHSDPYMVEITGPDLNTLSVFQ